LKKISNLYLQTPPSAGFIFRPFSDEKKLANTLLIPYNIDCSIIPSFVKRIHCYALIGKLWRFRLKILRIVGFILVLFMMLGVVVSSRPIISPSVCFNSLAEKRSVHKQNLFERTHDGTHRTTDTQVPEWVKEEALRQVKGTSYSSGLRALSAWRSNAIFDPSRFDNTGGFRRPSPPEPSDSGDILLDNNWNNDRRVNNDASGQQFHPSSCVGSDGTIYAAWAREIDADNYWIYFSKSTDGGDSWIDAVLVDNYGINNHVGIACYGTGSTADVYITYTYWYDYTVYDYDVVCAVSNTGGTSWAYLWYIQNTSEFEDMATVTTDNSGYAYVAYVYAWSSGGGCDPSTAESEIYMKRSTTHGASWSGAYQLTNYGGQHDDVLPAIAAQGGGASCILHLGWTHDLSGSGSNYDVRYKKITSAGGTPSIPSTYVTIASLGDNEYVIPGGVGVGPDGDPHIVYIYETATNGGGDIRYNRSYNGGSTFGSYQVISARSTEELDPSLAVDAQDNPVIVWRDARWGHTDIYVTYSDDRGISWRGEYKANQDGGGADQYWPTIDIKNDGWRRFISVAWWDTRYDDGDVYHNGNSQTGVALDVDYVPDTPFSPLPGFEYYAFETSYDTTFSVPDTYRIWYDDEYVASNDVLLDELWAGSGSTERWAIPNPGGWSWVAPSYYSPPTAGGAFPCNYYHQFWVIFNAFKGNPAACTHTLPNVDLDYQQFGITVNDTINDAIDCSTWVDMSTEFNLTGWVDLSPIQRWATVDPDTIGTVIAVRTVDVEYFHQWFPLILLVGPSDTNYALTWQHTQFGDPHLEGGLYTDWQDWTDCGSLLEFSDTTNPLGWYAIDSTLFTCLDYFSSTIRYSNNTSVTVRNDFGFGQIDVDYSTVASPSVNSWGPGSVHHIGAISPQTFADTVRYTYYEWSDAGIIDHDITVPDYDIIYTAYFDTEFKLDMTYSGATGGHVPTLTGEGWYFADSFATITASEAWDSVAGIRYGFSHWESIPTGAWFADSSSSSTTVIMDKHYTVVAVYSVQYSLVVDSDGGYGYPDPPIGTNWIDAGASICVYAGSPDTIAHMYATGWTGTGPVPATGVGDMACFNMSVAGTITWHWDNQLTLEIISTYGIPSPSTGTHYYDPGDYIECTVPTPFYLTGAMRAAITGFVGTSVIGSGSGSYVDFNIVENCTLTWGWNLEYSLIVLNPAGHGTPVPAAGVSWHVVSSMVMARVLSPDPPWVCIGFDGVPPALPLVSPLDSIVFPMIAPTTLTWLWADESEVVSFTVHDSGLGDPFPYGTTYWFPGSVIEADVTSPYPDPVVDGVAWEVDGYTGTGSCPSGSGSSTGIFFIWEDSEVSWHWHPQYRLSIFSEPSYYGAPVPDTGASYYDYSTLVSGSVTTPWEDSIVCTGFTGTGSAPPSDPGASFSFTLDEPSSVTWHWDISVVELQVFSDYNTPTPPVGTHVYATGSELTLSVNKYYYISTTERYICTGWIGTGDVPSTGSDTLVDITLNTNSAIIWEWQHQYRVDIDNPGDYDSPNPSEGQHWFDDDDWVTCYITTNPVDTMYCVGYYGTGSLGSEWGMDEVTFLLDEYTTLQWVWMGIGSIESLYIASDYGSPYPPVGWHYYPRSVAASCYITDCTFDLGSDERYRCIGYDGTGPVPSGGDTSVTFNITSSGTLTWLWQHQYTFEVQNPSGSGVPVPAVGTYWMPADEDVDAYITINPDGIWYCVGYNGWGALGSGYGDSVHFDLTTPSGILWNWMEEGDVVFLDVTSPYGPCDPPVGRNYIPTGVTMTATAGPYSYVTDSDRFAVHGWDGGGSVPLLGDSSSVEFMIDCNSTIDWNWHNEILLALTYMGCGAAVPAQSGEGWYRPSTFAAISTATSVDDGGSHYGFVAWSPSDPPAVSIAEPTYPNTDVQVFDPCTLTARYGPAVSCTLTKNPEEDYGGFIVDGTLYDDIHTYSDWWAVGSNHDIEATSPDTSGGASYVFDSWSDAGAIAHAVGPVETDVYLTAYYLQQYRLSLEKNPWHTEGFLQVGATVYTDSARVELWFSPGSAPTVGASDIDYPDAGERYSWASWSDGGAINHVIEPMTGSLDLIADYDHEFRLKVAKEPPETLGTITIDETLYEYVCSASVWFVPSSDTHYVDVSRLDYSGDSAYSFENFDGVLADTILPRPTVLTEPESLTAFYDHFAYILSFTINPDFWNLGAVPIPSNYTCTMIPPDVITGTNTGNIPLDFGFGMILDDTLTAWTCGCITGVDRVVLRTHMSLDPFPPAVFNPVMDCVKEMNTWCTPTLFGTHGWYVEPEDAQKIWLQMHTPLASSDLTEQTLILRVMARISLF